MWLPVHFINVQMLCSDGITIAECNRTWITLKFWLLPEDAVLRPCYSLSKKCRGILVYGKCSRDQVHVVHALYSSELNQVYNNSCTNMSSRIGNSYVTVLCRLDWVSGFVESGEPRREDRTIEAWCSFRCWYALSSTWLHQGHKQQLKKNQRTRKQVRVHIFVTFPPQRSGMARNDRTWCQNPPLPNPIASQWIYL